MATEEACLEALRRAADELDDLPSDTGWEELSVDQRWHYRNADRNTERTLSRRSGLRSWLNDKKRDQGCSRCGVDTPTCLDFHHRDGETKRMAVG